MKKSKLIKTALLAMTTVSALVLAACSIESEETKTDSGVESSETSEKADSSSEEVDNSDEEVTDDEKKEIQRIARSFYIKAYSFDVEAMEKSLNSEQPDILKGNSLEYDDEQKGQLAEALSIYHDDTLPLTNYEELSNNDKANLLMALGEIQGKMMFFGDSSKGVSAQTSGNNLTIDGDKANVVVIVEVSTGGMSEAFGDDVPESIKEEIPVQLVKTSDGWKVDGGFIAQEYQKKTEDWLSDF